MTDELSAEAKKRLAKLEKRLKKIVDEYKEETKGLTLEEALGVSEILGHDPKAPTPRVLMTDTALEGLPEKTLADFEPEDQWFEFIPQELPNFRYFQVEGELGTEKLFKLNVDGLEMAFQVGKVCRAPAAFYHLYKNQEDGSKEFRKLQKGGPEYGPHVSGGVGRSNTWYYTDRVPTAWLDINGSFIYPDQKYMLYKGVPVPLDETDQFLEGNTVTDGKGNRVELHYPESKVQQYPENEPEPEWHKTNPFKKVTNVQENKPKSRAKQRSKVSVSTGSDEQSNKRVGRGNSRPRKIS